jgi:hypothetical protein
LPFQLPEAQFEPGSARRVLKNRLGIVDPDQMDRVETRALASATDACLQRINDAQGTMKFHRHMVDFHGSLTA